MTCDHLHTGTASPSCTFQTGRTDRAILTDPSLKLTLGLILDQVFVVPGAASAAILLWDPERQNLDRVMARGKRLSPSRGVSLPPPGEQGQRALREQRPVLIHQPGRSAPGDRPALNGPVGACDYCIVPLPSQEPSRGVLEVGFARRAPGQQGMAYLSILAGQVAMALENRLLVHNLHWLNEQLAEVYDATIEGWTRALALRDHETQDHSRRVTEMTVRLARGLGVNEGDLAHVRRGALLHDIGKIGVPDCILRKPGALTGAEREVVRLHPELAYRMIEPIEYLRPAGIIPYCHHEKWDGSGYPRGLRGEKIPLAARVFTVIDVWDALTSDRPYRPAWSRSMARQYIAAMAGTHFDHRVVDAFLNLLDLPETEEILSAVPVAA